MHKHTFSDILNPPNTFYINFLYFYYTHIIMILTTIFNFYIIFYGKNKYINFFILYISEVNFIKGELYKWIVLKLKKEVLS
ncbi:hypothetical protein C672_1278 [[Clostridium] bifermentans ATCC 638]|uniref:Uncharacterized protein n=1 Tax=Paraclostridium bifermentans ATCC 638 = DSM 14991 TaxID=1233171 RepID=T4VNI4_PARBF|nr:hypothetical protein C672_1278 [[Clostridium] bifermentans ATCC 638] [Paraclostridium bifermentans ATCC 638 = DSM 14991]